MKEELEKIKMKIWQCGKGVRMKEIMGDIESLVNTESSKQRESIKNILDKYYVGMNLDGSYSADPQGNQIIDELRESL